MNKSILGISKPQVADSGDDIDILIKKLRDFDDHTRQDAAIKLSQYSQPKVIKALTGRLIDRSAQVRWQAIDALERINNRLVCPSLRARLKDEVPEVQAKAAEALGNLGYYDDATIDALVSAVADNDLVSKHAGIALGKLANSRAMDILLGQLDGNNVYKKQCLALAQYGYSSVIAKLFKTANSFSAQPNEVENDKIQSIAIKTMNYYKNRVTVLLSFEPQPFDEITKLYNPNFVIPNRAFSYRCNKNTTKWESLLVFEGYNPTNFLVTSYLVELNDDRILPWLRKILIEDQAPIIQWMILEKYSSMANYGDADVKAILNLMNTDFPIIRLKIIDTLDRMKATTAVEKLCSALSLRIGGSETNYALIRSLGNIGDARATPTLINELINNDENHMSRQLAAEALGSISSDEGIDALISALGSDGDADVRRTAAISLGRLNAQKAKRYLEIVAGGRDENISVVNAAKDAFSAIN